jgi:hypothetical protein
MSRRVTYFSALADMSDPKDHSARFFQALEAAGPGSLKCVERSRFLPSAAPSESRSDGLSNEGQLPAIFYARVVGEPTADQAQLLKFMATVYPNEGKFKDAMSASYDIHYAMNPALD